MIQIINLETKSIKCLCPQKQYATGFLDPVYTIQLVVKPIEQPVEQPAASCIQTFNRLFNRLLNRLFNRFDNRLYHVNGVLLS